MKLARMPGGQPEIFHSLQGEGRHSGRPSVFVRASLCNLSCQWCDTDYTWNWESTDHHHDRENEPGYAKYRKEEQIVHLSIAEIAERVAGFSCRHVVMTGGEPLIQQADWIGLMDALRALDPRYSFEIETNATLLPGPGLLDRIDQINASPKLANSGVPEPQRIRPEALRALARIEKTDFKFVIGDEDDAGEALALAREFSIPRDRIFFMPKARTASELDGRDGWLARRCLDLGVRYSDRLHLRLFGAGRGV